MNLRVLSWRKIGKFFPSLVVGGIVLLAVAKLWLEIENAPQLPLSNFMASLAVACGLSLANYLLRFWRWHWFLARLDRQPTWLPSMLSYFAGFAFTLLPGKAGELMRVRYYGRLGVEANRVAAIFFVERGLDLVAVCLLGVAWLPGAAIWRFWGVGAALGLVIIFALLFVGLRRCAWLDHAVSDDVQAAVCVRARAWCARLKSAIRVFRNQAQVLLEPSILLPGLAVGLLAWALEGIGFWVLVQASGFEVQTLLNAIAVYAASLVVGALSLMPGGLGGVEAFMLFSLRHAGMPIEDALVVTMLCRLATLWLAVVLGCAAIAVFALWFQGGRRGP